MLDPHSRPPPSARPTPVLTERRAHRRAKLDRPVLLETSARTITARAVDVSGGGISVTTDHPLEESASVGIYFELPIGYAVEGRAQVIRMGAGLVVLRFVEVPYEAVVAVRAFCRISGQTTATK